MSGTTCSNCGGSGSVVASIKFNISYRDIRDQIGHGETSYKTCDVCGGSGSVSLDKASYSHDPDVSLRNADNLFRRLGKPTQIHIPTQVDEVWVVFSDGSRYVFGAFGIGYAGTRPSNFKIFLDKAGFDISSHEIEEMQAPCTLKQGFSAPKRVLGTGVTVAEAEAAARAGVPAGAELIAVQVVDDGTSRTIESGGRTLDDAWKTARRRLPADGVVEEEKVIDTGGRGGRTSAWGANFGRTSSKLRQRMPPNADVAKSSYKKLLFWVKEENEWFVPAKVQIKFRTPVKCSATFVQRLGDQPKVLHRATLPRPDAGRTEVLCPLCQKRLLWDAKRAGQLATCPFCKGLIRYPAAV